uniref:Uncharacterized protein LOC114336755 n=1 Tax=Diabrotica virgifera virgifera TaxID=50390 RepID=A0A6P7G7I2_DIAVI
MSYTQKINNIHFDYKVNNILLSSTSDFKDLGVIFDSKLTFSTQINTVVSKATKSLGYIIRSCRDVTSVEALRSLYFGLVSSKLNYCSVVWNPNHAELVSNLESVQKRFLRYCYLKKYNRYPVRGYSYNLLLSEFGFHSLRKQREINGLIFIFKIVNCLINSDVLLSLVDFNVPRAVSRSGVTFHISVPNSQHNFYCPIKSMCRSVNNLRSVDIFFLSFNIFKREIRNSLSN